MKRPTAKCYLCGKEEKLKYIEFIEWLCEKDYARVVKFLDRLKTRKTRYKSFEAFIGGHKL